MPIILQVKIMDRRCLRVPNFRDQFAKTCQTKTSVYNPPTTFKFRTNIVRVESIDTICCANGECSQRPLHQRPEGREFTRVDVIDSHGIELQCHINGKKGNKYTSQKKKKKIKTIDEYALQCDCERQDPTRAWRRSLGTCYPL